MAALPDDRLMFTMQEAAQVLRVSISAVKRQVSIGNLEVVRIGRTVRISRQALFKFMNMTDEHDTPSFS